MTIVALTEKGTEYIYRYKTAHAVSKSKAREIVDVLNYNQFHIHAPLDTWHVYEIGEYDRAHDYANDQKFTYYKGIVKRKASYDWMRKDLL